MRIRTIKPEFFKHDGIAALKPLTRLLFIGLWSLADCDGRLEDRPQRIRVEVLPYDNVDAERLLCELAEAGFIIRYEADGLRLIELPSFSRHQRITGKEAETVSRFPKYEPKPQQKGEGNTGETLGKQPGSIGETPETTGREGKGRETEGEGVDGATAPAPTKGFAKPLLESVKLQCAKIGLPDTEADKFFNHYEANGWRVGRNPMRSWPAALNNWKRGYDERRYTHQPTRQQGADRNAGTANEGKAHLYAGIGRVQS
jgi:hypothetical protein